MKFGDNLRNLRKKKKLSQEELAEKMRVSRQSVSKWETGDAYPEMNNILSLCHIFHCNISDLVNDSIIDLDSLDDEIKMNIVKLKKNEQSKMKGLSKAIYIVAKVCRIIILVCVPIVIITMLTTAFLINKVNVSNNEITFKGSSEYLRVEEKDDKISIKINDSTLADISDPYTIATIKDYLENNSKTTVFIYTEIGLLSLIIYMILISIILKSLENLFKNINTYDTPFTLENVGYIKKMAYLMIVALLLPNIGGFIFEKLLDMNLGVDFELFNVVEILIIFSLAYIFQYGYEIQLDSKGKMYGDENE